MTVAWLSLATPVAHSQSAQQADSFIRAIYKQYSLTPSGPDILWKGAPSIFTPSLVHLIRHDQRESKGKVGELDADPICSCQDWEGLTVKDLRISKAGDKEATALVTVQLVATDPSTVQTLTLRLVWLPQGWRIDDIASKQVPSLKKQLR